MARSLASKSMYMYICSLGMEVTQEGHRESDPVARNTYNLWVPAYEYTRTTPAWAHSRLPHN